MQPGVALDEKAAELQTLSQQCKRQWRAEKRRHVHAMEDDFKTNPKKIFKYIRDQNRTSVDVMINESNQTVTSSNDIANGFANFFESVGREAYNDQLIDVMNTPVTTRLQAHDRITLADIYTAAKRLKPKSSMGPDSIPMYILKACIEPLSLPLLDIFNKALLSGIFPSEWKKGKVIALHKKGDKQDFRNYRSITLLNSFGKLFEMILLQRALPEFEPYVAQEQHGFVSGRSTTTNLIEFTQYIADAMDNGGQVDVATLDFQKAFNSVQAPILSVKLSEFLSNPLLTVLCDYLRNREQYVAYNGACSRSYPTLCGIPEGSVLAPLLFNIFINDLPTRIRGALKLLFADDVKLFRKITCSEDADQLQGDIESAIAWANCNSMSFNVNKCQIITFTRRHEPLLFEYKMLGATLQRATSTKDLGLNLDQKLSFNLHIETMIRQCYKTLGFIIRLSRNFTDINTIIALYKSLVRSRLEYGCCVWSPTTQVAKKSIEKVQKRFLRYLYFRKYGVYPHYLNHPVPTEQLELEFNIMCLENRRSMLQVLMFWQTLNGKNGFDFGRRCVNVNVPNMQLRQQRGAFALPHFRHEAYKTSPMFKMLTEANLRMQSIDLYNCTKCDIYNVFEMCYV